MKPELMQHLACPSCRAGFDLHVTGQHDAELVEGWLHCATCDVTYPIVEGIPRLLPAHLSAEKKATAAAFGYEWTHYAALTAEDRAEFQDWIAPTPPEFFRGKLVLDAGCGKGRHAFLAAEFGAREVVAVDLSDAVEAAYRNTRQLPNVHVVQADIYALPLRPVFDYAYSIGVLHHLPDPRHGFLSLVGQLRPGGSVSIWVYGKEGNWWISSLVDPLRTRVTARAPRWFTRAVSFFLALPLYVALKLVYRPARRLPALRRLLFYSDYLCAIADYSFAENYWNVFDHLVAPTAFYLSRDEVAEWFAATGMESVAMTQRNRNSWRGTGRMPADAAQPPRPAEEQAHT